MRKRSAFALLAVLMFVFMSLLLLGAASITDTEKEWAAEELLGYSAAGCGTMLAIFLALFVHEGDKRRRKADTEEEYRREDFV